MGLYVPTVAKALGGLGLQGFGARPRISYTSNMSNAVKSTAPARASDTAANNSAVVASVSSIRTLKSTDLATVLYRLLEGPANRDKNRTCKTFRKYRPCPSAGCLLSQCFGKHRNRWVCEEHVSRDPEMRKPKGQSGSAELHFATTGPIPQPGVSSAFAILHKWLSGFASLNLQNVHICCSNAGLRWSTSFSQ